MNFLNSLTTSHIKLSFWMKFLGIGFLNTLIFFSPVKAQTFSTPGNFTFPVPNFSGSLNPGDLVIVDIDLIIVGAGGGGGRGNGAGGGGGGQVIQMTITASEGDILSGFIGTGGAGQTNISPSLSGTATTFNGITAAGGGRGIGGDAGSGGNSGSGMASGTGDASSSREAGGGGGGAGGPGTNGVASNDPIGGNGGIGIAGYGGGGGGTATRPGGGGTITFGSAADGGRPGSSGTPLAASNGGGGGGGNAGGGRGGHGLVIVSVNFRVLPVEFLYFKSVFNSTLRSGDLTWATAKEWENSHFEIERSVNDIKSWETIGQVQGAGYSDQPVAYTFQDLELPLTGGNIFYRLKQVDLNGKSIFSDTKAIQVEALAGTTSWRVYPNPTSGQVFNLEILDRSLFRDEKITVRLISSTGLFIVLESISSNQLSIELSDLLKKKAAGLYTLEISWGENKEYHKVILRR